MCTLKQMSFFLQHGAADVMMELMKQSLNATNVDDRTLAVSMVLVGLLGWEESRELAIRKGIIGE
jgi:hypothetical protein